jgi:hypothetical protein
MKLKKEEIAHRDNLRSLAKALLFETFEDEVQMGNKRYGMFDQPLVRDQANTNLQSSVPLEASSRVESPLLMDAPPVDDDSYCPATVPELRNACYALLQNIAPDDVTSVYKKVKELATRYKTLQEARNIIAEQGPRYTGEPGPGEMPWEKDDNTPDVSGDREYSLDELAEMFGYNAGSGVRQFLHRITERLNYLVQEIPPALLQNLKDFAAEEYVAVMQRTEFLDSETAQEFLSNISHVQELHSYRYFLNNAFITPGWKAVQNRSMNLIIGHIERLELPKEAFSKLLTTIVNQATGLSAESNKKVWDQLSKLVPPPDVEDYFAKYLKILPLIKRDALPMDDLVPRAKEAYSKMPPGKVNAIMHKSLYDMIIEEKDIEFSASSEETYEFKNSFATVPIVTATANPDNVDVDVSFVTTASVTIKTSAPFTGIVKISVFETS